jgi:hypothetical protein
LKRIFLLLAVAVMMAVMLFTTAGLALAAPDRSVGGGLARVTTALRHDQTARQCALAVKVALALMVGKS